jgi:hypothetical protein
LEDLKTIYKPKKKTKTFLHKYIFVPLHEGWFVVLGSKALGKKRVHEKPKNGYYNMNEY